MNRGRRNNYSHYRNKNKKDDDLINVWEDTKKYFHLKSKVSFPKKFNLKICAEEIKDTSLYQDTVVEILNIDSFNLAIQYVNEGLNPVVLNMASDFKPGGGVGSGKKAQEEELFRRSNAHLTHPTAWYPLKNKIIYSPEITVIKDSFDKNYQYIPEKNVAMIACAAIRNPRLSYGDYNDEDYELTENKIEAIFKIAILEKHDSIVLGALGCGAFHNPPDEVAKLFKKYTDIYKNCFKKIGFAILVVKDSDNVNLDSFQKVFS
jgi:uncharacterized protein (TIGR02452 family)